MTKQDNFMSERITEDAGAKFAPARYGLKSKNDAIISPYATYDLFFEITFHVLQKLGAYEDIGTPEEFREAMKKQTPMEPVKTDAMGYRYTDTYRCPRCGGNFSGTGIADYCYHCGQALKW